MTFHVAYIWLRYKVLSASSVPYRNEMEVLICGDISTGVAH
jgi:hypothetical protein